MTGLQRVVPSALLLVALLPASLLAQPATLRARESLRSQPDGEVIGVLEPGLGLARVSTRAGWLEVDVEGWVWLRSLQTTSAGGHDLVVAADAGENLRAKPSGDVVGKLSRGTLLDERERQPGWVRVRRRGWVRGTAVNEATTARAQPSPQSRAGAPPAGQSRAAAPTGQTKSIAAPPASAPTKAAAEPQSKAPPGAVGRAGAAILAGPGGADTLARVRPGAQMQVLARQGSWARVRVEGWAWLPGDSANDLTPVAATPAQLAAQPDRYVGRVVAWDLQFLSLEKAERIRTEFFEGEPFLLTRHSAGGYVYVAVSPDRLTSASSLLPLERIHVVGRVRAPASALTGSPILDLIELTRARDRR